MPDIGHDSSEQASQQLQSVRVLVWRLQRTHIVYKELHEFDVDSNVTLRDEDDDQVSTIAFSN